MKYYNIFNQGTVADIGNGARKVLAHVVNTNVWLLSPSTLKTAHITIWQWNDLKPREIPYVPVELLNIIENNLKNKIGRQTSFVLFCRTQLLKEVEDARR